MLWGYKTQAWFDVWSIEHLIMGITMGGLVVAWNAHKKIPAKSRAYIDLVTLMCAAYIWEAVEFYLETGLAGVKVQHWFQGVELWANRLITDPLMVYLGWKLFTHNPKLLWPARFFSLGWLLLHIVIFPHSMHLHDLMHGSHASQLTASAAP